MKISGLIPNIHIPNDEISLKKERKKETYSYQDNSQSNMKKFLIWYHQNIFGNGHLNKFIKVLMKKFYTLKDQVCKEINLFSWPIFYMSIYLL